MTITHLMTFELGFCKKEEPEGEITMMTFSVYYDRALYEEPKDVAVDHWIKIMNINDGNVDFGKLNPVFRTFRCLNDRVPSDLGMK